MPSPVLIGKTYYLRVRVPSDIVGQVKGKTVSVTIGDTIKQVVASDMVKVSLGTSDQREAKQLLSIAQVSLNQTWQAIRHGPQPLSHKQLLALTGGIREAFISAFDDNPGSPQRWEGVLTANVAAEAGKLSLAIVKGDKRAYDLNKRFGGLVDSFLSGKGIILPPEQRLELIRHVAKALSEAAQVNLKKASGDYSESGETAKYPKLELATTSKQSLANITFEDIINRQVALDADDAALLRTINKKSPATIRKYRAVCSEFVKWRQSPTVKTISQLEVIQWMKQLLSTVTNSRTTIRLKAECLIAVCNWGQDQARSESSLLFEHGNPLLELPLPERDPVDSSNRSYTPRQAKTVLLATRQAQTDETRWVPWLTAYTGMRVGDVSLLKREHFKIVGGRHFMLVQFQKTKTPRWIPLHNDIINEGFMTFVEASQGSLFRNRTQSHVWEWINETVLKDEPQRPAANHGWRNLFESLFELYGVSVRAGLYLTGRAMSEEAETLKKSSAMGYQVPEIALLTYATELDKIKSILDMDD